MCYATFISWVFASITFAFLGYIESLFLPLDYRNHTLVEVVQSLASFPVVAMLSALMFVPIIFGLWVPAILILKKFNFSSLLSFVLFGIIIGNISVPFIWIIFFLIPGMDLKYTFPEFTMHVFNTYKNTNLISRIIVTGSISGLIYWKSLSILGCVKTRMY